MMNRFLSIVLCIVLCCIFHLSCKSVKNRQIASHGSIVSVRKPTAVTTSVKIELESLYVDDDSIAVLFIDNPPFSGKYMPPRYKDGWRELVNYMEGETRYPLYAQEY